MANYNDPSNGPVPLQPLEDVYEWLQDQIDGGEECRGRDSEISNLMRTLGETILLVRRFGSLASLWDGKDRYKRPYRDDDLASCHVGCLRQAKRLTNHWGTPTQPRPEAE